MNLISKIFGDANAKYLKKLRPIVEKINYLEKEFEKIPTERLKDKTLEFKERLRGGETLDDLLPEAFALVREAAKRTLKMRHFDVQLIGGIVLHKGQIAEMKTGEGKTLVATLPLYLNALEEKGCHLVTVNDYLARRDVEWMGPIYYLLGLSVGVLNHERAFLYQPKEGGRTTNLGSAEELVEVERKQAYLADITYGTNNEFGFDYLRDNMVYRVEDLVQRELNYAIIDEVDSILIDEARTPLIISSPAEESADLYYQLDRIVKQLKPNEDYNVDEKMKSVALTEKGQEKIVKMLGVDPWQEANFILVHHIEAALRANSIFFQKDRDYVVKDGEVIIVDEFTGRLMFGRRYSEGLHQAIEAKEGLEIKQESRTLATITFQNYFRMYKKLAGMTGTAITEAEEFYKIYGLEVVVIPTNKPLIRIELPDKIYATERAKFKAVVEEVKKRHQKGQPLLIGTTSIEKNELLSELLNREGIPHQVLNAKHHEKEAEIIAQAGRLGAVTVATNMAGRGVDIILGGNPPDLEEQKKVIELGGLHVIGTERHEARRIDNQLRGRAGRQGDPGSSQFFISLEDDLMRIFGGERLKSLMSSFHLPEDHPIENRLVSRSVEAAQRKVEGMNFDLRKHLLEYDDILNKHRETIYRRRRQILFSSKEQVRQEILKLIEKEIEQVVGFHTAGDRQENWNLKEIIETMATIFPTPPNLLEILEELRAQAGERLADAYVRDRIIKYLIELSHEAYQRLEERIKTVEEKLNEKDLLAKAERAILLQSIDQYWVWHLEVMENLRTGVGLRAYGQHEPLVEYKREAYLKFNQLLEAIDRQVVYSIYKISLVDKISQPIQREIKLDGSSIKKTANLNKSNNKNKIGRNDPCPCGSGKKYKKCCYPKFG
jgi:preprotein translocase subunit SecA